MLTIALSLLGRFWKPLLLGFLVIGLGYSINRWDNKRLETAYHKGYDEAFWAVEQKEQQIIANSEKISQENARELNFLENQQEIVRQVVYEQINTYIKETVFECHPDAQYLSLYDNATRNPLNSEGTGNSTNRVEPAKEGSGLTGTS